MKQFILSIVMLVMAIGVKAEGFTVGNTDNTSGWWAAFSPTYTLDGDGYLEAKFVNHNAEGDGWFNWLFACANAERGAEGYKEYFIIRADNWWWAADVAGNNTMGIWNNMSIDSNFSKELNGATIVVKAIRSGNIVTVTQDITTSTGKNWMYKFTRTTEYAESLKFFFTTEKAYQEFEYVTTGSTTKGAGVQCVVGSEDNSDLDFRSFSPSYSVKSGETLTLNFKNYTSGTDNWNNYYLVCTNDQNIWTWGDNAYTEIFVMRADNYWWGNGVAGNNNGMTSNFDWDNFKQDMNGADIKMKVTRVGDNITVNTHITTTSAKEIDYNFAFAGTSLPETVRFFLTGLFSHQEVYSASVAATPTPIKNIAVDQTFDENAPAYDVYGREVKNGAKGLMIQNGRKYIRK